MKFQNILHFSTLSINWAALHFFLWHTSAMDFKKKKLKQELSKNYFSLLESWRFLENHLTGLWNILPFSDPDRERLQGVVSGLLSSHARVVQGEITRWPNFSFRIFKTVFMSCGVPSSCWNHVFIITHFRCDFKKKNSSTCSCSTLHSLLLYSQHHHL